MNANEMLKISTSTKALNKVTNQIILEAREIAEVGGREYTWSPMPSTITSHPELIQGVLARLNALGYTTTALETGITAGGDSIIFAWAIGW